MIIAQVTDMHVRARGAPRLNGMDTGQCLAACVARINGLSPAPDVAVLTGDLVNGGTEDEYEYLRDLLEPLAMPIYLIPGNHDEREAMRRAFRHHDYLPRRGRLLNYVLDDYPLRFIALDTVIPGEPGGRVGAEQLDWLAARLAEAPDRPTVILMHHPPFETGIVHMDEMNCADAEDLGAVVARHPQVERILCGHVHRPIQVRRFGTFVSIGPSTAFQVALELHPEAPASWIAEPPAFHLHLWRPGTGLVSHTLYVGDFGAPHRFQHAE
ncbi:MAG: phosphodiesterase [Alphaproteobacteria bacterium]